MRPENNRRRVGSGQKLNGRNAKERLPVWKQGCLKYVKSEFVSTRSPQRHHANLLTPQIHFDVAPKCTGGLQGDVSHWRVRGKLPFQANRRENYTWRWINPSGPTLLSPSGVRGDQIQAFLPAGGQAGWGPWPGSVWESEIITGVGGVPFSHPKSTHATRPSSVRPATHATARGSSFSNSS